MSDRPSNWTMRLVIAATVLAAIAGISAAAGGLWSMFVSDSDLPPSMGDAGGALAEMETDWSGGDPQTIELDVDGARGPIWVASDGPPIRLTPIPREADLSWSAHRTGGTLVVRGTGRWNGARVAARWQFEPGNPQATVDLRVHEVPLPLLRKNDWSGPLALPAGELRISDGFAGLTDGEAINPPYPLSAVEER